MIAKRSHRRACGAGAILAALLAATGAAGAAEPVVTSVRGQQRPATELVEIYYNLVDADSATCTVRLEVSADGGATWDVPVATVSQDVGPGVRPGTGKFILWNAGADWDGQYSNRVRFRVTASDAPAVGGEFALIPAGSFQMGDSFAEGWSDERPVHTVNVSAFYMAKHETTKELWDEVRAWGLNNGYTDLQTGNGAYASKGANHPVHSVSWHDIVKWCNARSQKEGLTPCYTVGGAVFKTGIDSSVSCNFAASGYRLPTEAEWEKAARGGLSGKRFPWGDTINHSHANYRANGSAYTYDTSPYTAWTYHPTYNDGSLPHSSPVGSFAPNGYGLYDMAGNMWEWCWDWYGSSYYGSSPASDPRGPSSGSNRVFRGGVWGEIRGAFNCRVAFRYGYDPAGRYSGDFGFRSARSSVP